MKNTLNFLSWKLMLFTALLLFLVHSFLFLSWSKLDEKGITCACGNKMLPVIYDTLSAKVMMGDEDFRQLFHQPLCGDVPTALTDAELLGAMVHSSSAPVVTRRFRLNAFQGSYAMIANAI